MPEMERKVPKKPSWSIYIVMLADLILALLGLCCYLYGCWLIALLIWILIVILTIIVAWALRRYRDRGDIPPEDPLCLIFLIAIIGLYITFFAINPLIL